MTFSNICCDGYSGAPHPRDETVAFVVWKDDGEPIACRHEVHSLLPNLEIPIATHDRLTHDASPLVIQLGCDILSDSVVRKPVSGIETMHILSRKPQPLAPNP